MNASDTRTDLKSLPASGYIRQSDILGEAPVTPEQAEANKLAGRSPVRARAGRQGLVPFSSATLWRKVKAGEFPAPVKLSEGVTAWRVADVLRWLESPAESAAQRAETAPQLATVTTLPSASKRRAPAQVGA